MTARYWVPASDELLRDMDLSLLPDGLRMAGRRGGITFAPGVHEVLFEDDNAPGDLDGKRVELTLGRQGGEGAKAVIVSRRVLG